MCRVDALVLAFAVCGGCTFLYPFRDVDHADDVAGQDAGSAGDAASDSAAETDATVRCADEDLDGDGDGVRCGLDCDDTDVGVHPGARDGRGPGEWREPVLVGESAEGQVDMLLDERGVAHVLHAGAGMVALAIRSGPNRWRPRSVFDQSGVWGRLQIGSSGALHVVTFFNGEVYYLSSNDGFEWNEHLSTEVSAHPLALHVSGGDVFIGFTEQEDGATHLRYFQPEGKEFVRHTMASLPGDPSEYRVAFATTREGDVVAAFSNDVAGVWAARDLEGGGARVSSDPAGAISLGIDANDRLAIAYRSGGQIWFATEPAFGEWTPQPVDDEGAGAQLDLAFDSRGIPWIASFACEGQCSAAVGGALWIHTLVDGQWAGVHLEQAGGSVSWPAIAIDQDDAVHVAFADVVARNVYYLTNQLEVGDDNDCDGVPGMDWDGDGFASILTGGEDCDDEDADINPGATDAAGGRDADCDGAHD